MSEALINTYESASKIMAQMLIAAKQDAWEKVSELEQSYMIKVEVIRAIEQSLKSQHEALLPPLLKRKKQLLQQILADDGEIRDLLYPVMHRITDMIFDAQSVSRLPPDAR